MYIKTLDPRLFLLNKIVNNERVYNVCVRTAHNEHCQIHFVFNNINWGRENKKYSHFTENKIIILKQQQLYIAIQHIFTS